MRVFGRFALVGVAGFIVNGGLVEVLARPIGPLWAQGVGFSAAVTVTWLLNRRFTFNCSGFSIGQEWIRYVFANSVGWCVNNGIYIAMIYGNSSAYLRPSLAVAAGSIAGLVFNFSLSRYVVFRR